MHRRRVAAHPLTALLLAPLLALVACSDDASGPGSDSDDDSGDLAADNSPDRDLEDDPVSDSGSDSGDLAGDPDAAADTPDDPGDDGLADVTPDAHDGGDDSGGSDVTDLGDLGDDAGDAAGDTTGPGCDYPVVWEPEPGLEASVAAALTALAPDATLAFSAPRGTMQSANGMNLPVECADDENLFDALFAIIDANPDVFQIDIDEWETPPPLNCVNIDESNTTLTVLRLQLGTQPILRDTMALSVRREDGVIRFRSFFATYLPTLPPDLEAELLTCRELTLETARAAVMNTTFPYTTFNLCAPTGSGEYAPNALDTVELDESAHWSWNELGGEVLGVELVREHFGRLVVDESNVTEAHESSDINCPNEEGDARVYGFRVTFDAVLGTILSKMPGIGCIVC